MWSIHNVNRMLFGGFLALFLSMACTLGDMIQISPGEEDQMATHVAETLAELRNRPAEGSATEIQLEPTNLPTFFAQISPEPPTAIVPPSGVSMNCDGSYQQVRITDAGSEGKTVWLDNWDGDSWINVWSYSGGDAMMRQIEDEVGLHRFGACESLLVLPIRHTGSGTPLELYVFAWNGVGLSEVYSHLGSHGTWRKEGNSVIFLQSAFLFDEPNCCPCNMRSITHTWDGTSFIEAENVLTPTYSGTPPPECLP